MNLRDFKKDVDFFFGEFIEDCLIFVKVNKCHEGEKTTAVVEEAIDLYNEIKDKANAKVDTGKRAYFNNLRKEMFEGLDSLYEKLSTVVSETGK